MTGLATVADRPTDDAGRARRLPRPLVVGTALIGVALRVVVMAGPLGRANSDEVLTGLMARHLGADGYPVFVWGQHYGGTAELLPVAASLRLFGWSTTALRAPNLVLAVVIAVLVWRAAVRVTTEARAQLAGLLIWVFPAPALWFGLREQLFYPLTVVLGLGLILLAHRIVVGRRLLDFFAFGVVAGLAFWTSPFFIYFALPAGVVTIAGFVRGDRRGAGRGAGAAVVGALMGAMPWLIDNLHTGWASLHAGASFPTVGTYPERVGYFFTDALPGMLGLRQTFTHAWIFGPVGFVVYLAFVVAIGAGLVVAGRSWRRAGAVPWDAPGAVLFPFVFAAFPFVSQDPIYRYVFFVVPFVVVVGVRLVSTRRATIAVLGAAVVLTLISLQQLYVVAEVDRAAGIGTLDLAPTRQVLESHHIDAVFADYWIAYRVTFDTDERVIGSPSSGSDRYPPYDDAARASQRSGWVVVPGAQQDALLADLEARGIAAEVIAAGDLTVVIPDRPVLPETVPEAARRGT
jgi:hypothetical protein